MKRLDEIAESAHHTSRDSLVRPVPRPRVRPGSDVPDRR